MSAKTTSPLGCRGCGARDHLLPECCDARAATFYEYLGKPEDAAKVRRRIATRKGEGR